MDDDELMAEVQAMIARLTPEDRAALAERIDEITTLELAFHLEPPSPSPSYTVDDLRADLRSIRADRARALRLVGVSCLPLKPRSFIDVSVTAS